MSLKYRKTRTHSGFVFIELLAVILIIAILIALLLPSVQQARERARAMSCQNNLMQIGVALQNYQMAHLVLPSGSVNPIGPILNQPEGYHVSWVIQILPFLDERAAFHSYDFKLGVYDVVNRTTVNYTLTSFICPSSPNQGYNYVGCHNDLETPIDINNNGVLFLNSSIREKDLKDGRSHTIFAGEARDGGFLSWTSGTSSTLRNMGDQINSIGSTGTASLKNFQRGRYDGYSFEEEVYDDEDGYFDDEPEGPKSSDSKDEEISLTPEERQLLLQVGGFSSFHPDGAHFLLGDGSVQFIGQYTNFKILKNLANRDDGNLIGEY